MNRTMDNLEQLPDEELQQRLLQFGFPRLPVTGTTRKIIIKKLRNIMNNEKAKLRRETKYATRYSSDEDSSDVDSRKKQQRATTVGASTVRTSSYNSQMPPPATTTIRRATTITSNVGNIGGMTSSSPIQDSKRSPESSRNLRNSIYVPPPILATDSDDDIDYSYRPNNSINSRLSASPSVRSSIRSSYSTNANYLFTPDKSLDESSSSSTASYLRNRYKPLGQKINVDSSPPVTNGNHRSGENSLYSSDFTQRLLKLRGDTIRDSVYKGSYPTPPPREPSDVVYQVPEPQQNISPRAAFSNLINRLDEQYGVKQTLIPCVLLSALIVFFALVSVMYLTISPDLANTISERNTFYKICDSDVHSAVGFSQLTCIEQGNLNGALELLRVIAPELQKRTEYHKCKDSTVPFTLGAKEIVRLVQASHPHINVRQTIRDLHNVEYLIHQNPQWKISPVDADGNPLTFDQVLALRDAQAYSFAILNPRLPFTCSLYNKLQKFFLYVGIIGISLVAVGGLYMVYKLIVRYRQSKRDTVAYLNDEIINNLMRKAASNPDEPLVVVNHLRDKLIPLHKRRKMEWAWNETIRFLQQNDSRVQFEVGIRNGEECLMMKWVDTISPEQIGQRSPIKKWHSPAFDNTNKIVNPPTPCLKIRYMFDKHEANNPNLKTIIQDAILEKVGSDCKIYDIQLDKVNCWVYVRCASDKDAGIVHDKINGWWFDKRLVSIKFLRLERYLSRFSNSSSGPTCLRPSNTKNLSMSQCEMRDANAMHAMEDDDDDLEDDEMDDD